MSDTLQEGEDQMIATAICICHKFIRLHDGTCPVHGFVRKQLEDDGEYCDECKGPAHAPWCSSYKEPITSAPDIECQFCGFKGTFTEGAEHRKVTEHLIRTVAVGDLRRSQSSSRHQPAARGGGDEWRADEYEGYGYVWQGMGLLAKCPEPSRAEQIVTEHNQHQALVAERESFARLLKAAKFLLAMNATNYDRDVMRSEGGFDALQKAVDTIEKGLSA